MKQVTDFLRYENIPFDELSDSNKEKVQKLSDKIKEAGLETILLTFDPEIHNIRWWEKAAGNTEISTTIAKDLTDKIFILWQEVR